MLERPLPDLAAWAQCFRDMPIPVQAATAEELALMAQVEALRSDIDADQLSDPVGSDPLMALKLMAKAASLRRGRFDDDSGDGPETVTAALVLMGIGPFFRHFSELTTVEALLADRPDALAGLRRVIHRAHRAANFSRPRSKASPPAATSVAPARRRPLRLRPSCCSTSAGC